MKDDFMLAGPRPRSRVYKALRVAFNAFAIAAFLACVGVAMRDLASSQIWYSRFWFSAQMMIVIGICRIAYTLVRAVGALAISRFQEWRGCWK
ncbi:hypothetical protein [Cupriavidus sp. TMH.W2]|uniref:hypothetical protein n=1 Tax=Cupriavidus sp. TMH.W2 TaxID=3434465 RepID=UPI003D7776CB